MPVPTIDVAFVQEYEAGVHMAYQRQGSLIRGTIRTKNGVKNKTTFQKIGKGSATQRARHGQIPPMNVDHTNVSVTVEDWYAGDWIDDLDTLRVNHDEFMVVQQSGAWALGRKTDDQLLAAMATSTTTQDETANGATLAWAIALGTKAGKSDIPEGSSNRFVCLDYNNWGKLMAIDQFNRAEYVGNTKVLTDGHIGKMWLGWTWYPHSGIDTTGANATNFAYHRTAVGHAIGNDVEASMQYYNTHDSTFSNNKMQMNAVAIDITAIIKCSLKVL